MTATTSRVDMTAALTTVLEAYKTANPTLLKAVYPARPESFGDLPCAFFGDKRESIRMDVATWDRDMLINVCLVDRFTTSAETVGRLDILVDAVLGTLQSGYRAITGGPPMTVEAVEGGELDGGGVFYQVERITVQARFSRGSGL